MVCKEVDMRFNIFSADLRYDTILGEQLSYVQGASEKAHDLLNAKMSGATEAINDMKWGVEKVSLRLAEQDRLLSRIARAILSVFGTTTQYGKVLQHVDVLRAEIEILRRDNNSNLADEKQNE